MKTPTQGSTEHPEQSSLNKSDLNTRNFLNQELEHSLRLEAAMLQLQKEFRHKGENISRNISKLGQLLGVDDKVA